MLFYQISVCTTRVKTLKSHAKTIKFKISAPTWNKNFDLLDGSHSASDIQYYFEHI